MSIINMDTRIIGRSGDLLMLSNDFHASLDSFSELGFVVEKDTGKILTAEMPINYLLRVEEDLEWTPDDEFYENDYPDRMDLNHSKNGLIGFAIGDALGVPVEFLDRETVRSINVQDMMGKNTKMSFKSRWGELIPAGAWSDDTSMIYATMSSIIKKKAIDYNDIMKSYLDWWKNGSYSSLNFPFGLGRTVGDALSRYSAGTPPLECGGTGLRDNGNGALMRIFPFSLYCIESDLSEKDTVKIISEGSAITHGHDISKMSCMIYTEFLRGLIDTRNPQLSLQKIQKIDYSKFFSQEAIDAHKRILNKQFAQTPDQEMKGSGYVVDSLECAVYSVVNTDNYEDAIKMAINMGYDTDTIGGITGSLAGVLYGEDNIPERWKKSLIKKEELDLVSLKYQYCLDLIKKNELKDMMTDSDDSMNGEDINKNYI